MSPVQEKFLGHLEDFSSARKVKSGWQLREAWCLQSSAMRKNYHGGHGDAEPGTGRELTLKGGECEAAEHHALKHRDRYACRPTTANRGSKLRPVALPLKEREHAVYGLAGSTKGTSVIVGGEANFELI